jgi:hypothetical protein
MIGLLIKMAACLAAWIKTMAWPGVQIEMMAWLGVQIEMMLHLAERHHQTPQTMVDILVLVKNARTGTPRWLHIVIPLSMVCIRPSDM